VAEVTELMAPADGKAFRRLMALCVHRPPKYIPDFLVRDLLRVPTYIHTYTYLTVYVYENSFNNPGECSPVHCMSTKYIYKNFKR
jgi:hypothetical protein